MDITLYVTPSPEREFKSGTIGESVAVGYTEAGFESMSKGDIAILCVPEYRNAASMPYGSGVEAIRDCFFALYANDKLPGIFDLGTLLPGDSPEDTYFALGTVVREAVKREVVPIILGGSHDLTWGQYKGYEQLEQVVNLLTVDNRYDLGSSAEEELTDKNYLSSVLLHQPNYLFNYCNVGWQRYNVPADVLELMDELHFDGLRLGEFRNNHELAEPLFRNADAVSFDWSALKYGDANDALGAGPNGISSDELCVLSRYAGISDKVSSFGLYGYSGSNDHTITAELGAQCLWYFVEGVVSRRHDVPDEMSGQYLKYRVKVTEEQEDLVFLKSLKTDRWWMKVPMPSAKRNTYRRHQMVSCAYSDYLEACGDELPDLWLKTYRKFL